jgi:phosphonate transport system ATP-binding protein
LILADEPVASLDPSTARQVLSLLRQVCREDGITAVVSLHQVEFALSFADRIIGLAQGEVLFDRDPARISPADLHGLYNQSARGGLLPESAAAPSLEICGAAA